MSIHLSQDQIEDINSYLDNELASVCDEKSENGGSIAPKKPAPRSNASQGKYYKTEDGSNLQNIFCSTDDIVNLQMKISALEKKMVESKRQNENSVDIFNYQKKMEKKKKRKLSAEGLATLIQLKQPKSKKSTRSKSKLTGVVNAVLIAKKLRQRSKARSSVRSSVDSSMNRSRTSMASKQHTDNLIKKLSYGLQTKFTDESDKEKLKVERGKVRMLRKENMTLQNELKMMALQVKRVNMIERDYESVKLNLQRSEMLRLEQKTIIDKMRIEMNRLKVNKPILKAKTLKKKTKRN